MQLTPLRPCLLLLALLFGSLGTRAQRSLTDTIRLQPTGAASDTVAALHQFFAAQRAKRNALATLSLVMVGTTGYATTQAYSLSDFSIAYGATVGALSIGGMALAYYSQYSRRHEFEAVEALRAHQLPKKLERKLKKHYLKPASSH